MPRSSSWLILLLAEAAPMDQPPVILPVQQQPSRVPLWLVAAANAIVLLITIPFYFVPIGARLRPMSWAVWVLMLAAVGVVGFILVLPTRGGTAAALALARRRLGLRPISSGNGDHPPRGTRPQVYLGAMIGWANERPGVDARWRVLFAFQRPRSRATQAERSVKEHVHVIVPTSALPAGLPVEHRPPMAWRMACAARAAEALYGSLSGDGGFHERKTTRAGKS